MEKFKVGDIVQCANELGYIRVKILEIFENGRLEVIMIEKHGIDWALHYTIGRKYSFGSKYFELYETEEDRVNKLIDSLHNLEQQWNTNKGT